MRRAWALLLITLLAPGACARKAPSPAAVTLDCRTPFQTLAAKVTSQPNLVPAPVEPGEPYRTYSLADGSVSYFVTEPGAPAHPAILMQQALPGGNMKNTGCAYGDQAAYGELMGYLAGLKAGRK